MQDVLNSPVLVLNKNWQPMGEKNVRRAFEDMASGLEEAPFRGMDIELDSEGELLYANPMDLDDWLKLPVRPGDQFVWTGRRHIRVPTVMISTNFSRINLKPVKLSSAAIHRRDKHQCQYCHKFFPLEELNVDHVTPQFHGGGNSWENMVCSCRKCNSKKGHKFNHEIGYKLLKEPAEPKPIPTTFVTEIKHPSWKPFLHI